MNALDLPALAPELEWITDSTRVHKFSQDFNWYSPVLKRQLEGLSAQVVARPKTQEEIAQVVSLCASHQVPLTLRGTGTGNYGQCVPLKGGVVLDLSAYNQFLGIRDGVATAQSGIRLIELDKAAKPLGYELRVSTRWRGERSGDFQRNESPIQRPILWPHRSTGQYRERESHVHGR
jgi:FAD/FMN-containing dehydrogenase